MFEWTIDEVSSLGQANFEPYESQFLQTPDTAREAKAQAAISAYFNEISGKFRSFILLFCFSG